MINEHRERTEEVKSESQREPFTSLVVDRKISKSKKPLVIKQETRYNQDIKSKKNHMGAFYPFVSESNLTLSKSITNLMFWGKTDRIYNV